MESKENKKKNHKNNRVRTALLKITYKETKSYLETSKTKINDVLPCEMAKMYSVGINLDNPVEVGNKFSGIRQDLIHKKVFNNVCNNISMFKEKSINSKSIFDSEVNVRELLDSRKKDIAYKKLENSKKEILKLNLDEDIIDVEQYQNQISERNHVYNVDTLESAAKIRKASRISISSTKKRNSIKTLKTIPDFCLQKDKEQKQLDESIAKLKSIVGKLKHIPKIPFVIKSNSNKELTLISKDRQDKPNKKEKKHNSGLKELKSTEICLPKGSSSSLEISYKENRRVDVHMESNENLFYFPIKKDSNSQYFIPEESNDYDMSETKVKNKDSLSLKLDILTHKDLYNECCQNNFSSDFLSPTPNKEESTKFLFNSITNNTYNKGDGERNGDGERDSKDGKDKELESEDRDNINHVGKVNKVINFQSEQKQCHSISPKKIQLIKQFKSNKSVTINTINVSTRKKITAKELQIKDSYKKKLVFHDSSIGEYLDLTYKNSSDEVSPNKNENDHKNSIDSFNFYQNFGINSYSNQELIENSNKLRKVQKKFSETRLISFHSCFSLNSLDSNKLANHNYESDRKKSKLSSNLSQNSCEGIKLDRSNFSINSKEKEISGINTHRTNTNKSFSIYSNNSELEFELEGI